MIYTTIQCPCCGHEQKTLADLRETDDVWAENRVVQCEACKRYYAVFFKATLDKKTCVIDTEASS
ncbi:MAG: phage terminase large subunit family protein [Peptococcaceae bacterium]|nr:phage terminase large subunit family protein [Peptococcaceae bacterium]